MGRTTKILLACALLALLTPRSVFGQMPVEQAWQQLPKYEFGQDMAAVLAIDRVVIEAMDNPSTRAECAARLATLLQNPDATLAAKQYACFQLRQVGTVAEVPVLSPLLARPETAQMARYAIAAIPGRESLDALRGVLDTLQGDLLMGVIHSLGDRGDTESVAKLETLAQSADVSIRSAAVVALGKIGDDRSIAFLSAQMSGLSQPWPREWATTMLAVAHTLVGSGDVSRAQSIFEICAAPRQHPATRRAAMEGLLSIERPNHRAGTVSRWFLESDAAQHQVAACHLNELSDEQLDALAQQLPQLSDENSLALMDVIASRKRQNLLPLVLSMVRSEVPDIKLAGLRYLGAIPEASVVPILIDQLGTEERMSQAAQRSLARLPREFVGPALLQALERADIRQPVIAVLKELKYYEAIDPLIATATSSDPSVYEAALDGLRSIADPDSYDVPRLVQLLLKTQPGTHRDEVEKTIAIVCDKLPAGEDRARPVLDALASGDESRLITCLPLLGRLGGPQALSTITPLLESKQQAIADAAVRALCNWPTAEVADRLLQIAESAADKRHRRAALRGYVRVVSLPSDRSPDETLAMLKTAMKQAREAEDQQLVITRASNVRTMEAVDWLAGYIDDPRLAQSACQSLVELAHHRELRNPHMDRFGPLLDRVATISTDPDIVARAKRYRLGL